MEGINPKTLNEKIKLKKCLQLRKYAPSIPDEKIKQIYEFLGQKNSKVILTPEMLYFADTSDKIISAFVLPQSKNGTPYNRIELTARVYNVTHTVSRSSGYGCSSCGGCSSNNNNNNNNNNG